VIHTSTAGRILVATPPLVDPNFDRTVVYMIEHNDQGALGVVINRPTDEGSLPGLEAWIDLAGDPNVVFSGGPVELNALIGLAYSSLPDRHDGWAVWRNGIGTVDLSREPYEIVPAVERIRLFRGYSGWAPWQLDAELEAGAWIVLDADHLDPFSSEPDELWREVLRRQGGRLSWLANAPDDLSAN
jgi:putative transcriptional regulator